MVKPDKPILRNMVIRFLIILFFISCSQKQNKEPFAKELFYTVTKDSKLKGYNYRKYIFKNDTIIENLISFDLKGKIIDTKETVFFKTNDGLYLFSKWNSNIKKDLYFLNDKDSCYFIQQQFKRFNICAKHFDNFKKYKNIYRVNFENYADDSGQYSLILNKEYIMLESFGEFDDSKREIMIKNKEVPNFILQSFSGRVTD